MNWNYYDTFNFPFFLFLSPDFLSLKGTESFSIESGSGLTSPHPPFVSTRFKFEPDDVTLDCDDIFWRRRATLCVAFVRRFPFFRFVDFPIFESKSPERCVGASANVSQSDSSSLWTFLGSLKTIKSLNLSFWYVIQIQLIT